MQGMKHSKRAISVQLMEQIDDTHLFTYVFYI